MLSTNEKLYFDFKVAPHCDQLLTQVLIAAEPDAKPAQWRPAQKAAYRLAKQIGSKANWFIRQSRLAQIDRVIENTPVGDAPNSTFGPGHWTGD